MGRPRRNLFGDTTRAQSRRYAFAVESQRELAADCVQGSSGEIVRYPSDARIAIVPRPQARSPAGRLASGA